MSTEMVTGVFMENCRQSEEEAASLVVLGAGGSYSELLSWDANIVDAFVDLHIPVLVIPSNVEYHPVRKIAFVVNHYRKNLTHLSMIKRLVNFTKAELQSDQCCFANGSDRCGGRKTSGSCSKVLPIFPVYF